MPERPECPKCPEGVREVDGSWTCDTHGRVPPLWRADRAEYDAFARYLRGAGTLQTWLPWPLPPGWQLTDFGYVADDAVPRAAYVTVTGMDDGAGPVELSVVTEEPGSGVGARCAGLPTAEPGRGVGVGVPTAKVNVEGATTPLWQVATDQEGEVLDRTVLVGEASGRWLWLVLRPASAVLLLSSLPGLRDVSGLGPELVALPFGPAPPAW